MLPQVSQLQVWRQWVLGDAFEFFSRCEFNVFRPVDYRLTDCSNCHEDRSTIDDDSQPSDCPQICPALYDPVCGRDKSKRYREFSNACFMGIHNCQNPHNRNIHLSFCQKKKYFQTFAEWLRLSPSQDTKRSVYHFAEMIATIASVHISMAIFASPTVSRMSKFTVYAISNVSNVKRVAVS